MRQDFSVIPSPLGTNLGFEQGWTWLGLGLGGNQGLGPGLDNQTCRQQGQARNLDFELLNGFCMSQG